MTDAPGGGPEIVLDLSRLLSRVLHPTPTGVDRCEMAYARGLLAAVPARLSFGAVHPSGFYGRLPRTVVERFLDLTEMRWEHGGFSSFWELRRFAVGALAALRPRPVAHRSGSRPIYLQASPSNLVRPTLIESILRRERARFVCLLHDLIPLQYPEYARPNGARLHARRIATITRLADGVIANSQATLDALRPHLAGSGRSPLTTVAHLGVDVRAAPPARPPGRPYFLAIGTIEPRKNHLLLLNLWRRMAERDGAAAVPRLLVVGRRGWENEQVVDMLERCPALVGCVEELGAIPDRDVQALLANARGLLLPSFAEGYGMPVSEALIMGVPLVCSDLPALREAGGNVPHFLDPLDGLGWAAAIADLTREGSLLGREQVARRVGWRPPQWSEHIAIVLELLHRLAT